MMKGGGLSYRLKQSCFKSKERMVDMKKIFCILLSLMLIISLAACGGSSSSNTGSSPAPSNSSQSSSSSSAPSNVSTGNSEPTEPAVEENYLKFGEKGVDAGSTAELWHYWEEILDASGSGLTADCFFNAQLGTDTEMMEQILLDEPILLLTDCSLLSAYAPELDVLNGPYCVVDINDYYKIWASDWFKEQVEILRQNNIHLVNCYDPCLFGFRNFIANKPIRSPEDLKGMKIRTMTSQMCMSIVEAMGGVPTPLSFSEVYTALAQNVVDGAENPLTVIYENKHHEKTKFISMTNHQSTVFFIVMSENVWNSLPESQQAALENTGIEAAQKYNNTFIANAQASVEANLEADGCTIIKDVDVPAFKEATKDVYKVMGLQDVYDRVQSEIAAMN